MSIRYDDNRVKRPFAEHEYTNEEVLELEKCSKDFKNFIKYIKIVNPDEGEIAFEPRDYQQEFIDMIIKNRMVIALMARQLGKCVHSKTLIKIKNKRTGKIEDTTIGDFFRKFSK